VLSSNAADVAPLIDVQKRVFVQVLGLRDFCAFELDVRFRIKLVGPTSFMLRASAVILTFWAGVRLVLALGILAMLLVFSKNALVLLVLYGDIQGSGVKCLGNVSKNDHNQTPRAEQLQKRPHSFSS